MFRRLLFVCLSILLVANVFAQTPTGQISGSAVDDSGAALPGVTVTAHNKETGISRSTVTNPGGLYLLALLPSGPYDVSAELSGFQAFRRQSVVVHVGSDVTVKILMRMGVQESITVSGQAPVVETTRSSVASTVNETMIDNLPVNGRNFIDFAVTTPGVTKDARFGDISFAGMRGTMNSLVVDGADNNNTFFGDSLGRTGDRTAYQFSQDAVKEFQINSNSYSAEFGRAGGAVINVITRSGTNNFDGAAFDFYRDKRLRAKDYIEEINNRPKGPFHFDQYGGSVGGPIIPDRHFFFLNYEAQRNTISHPVVPQIPANAPTDADTLAGIARLQPLATPYDFGRDQDIYLIKTDHEVGRNHVSLRYNKHNFTGKSFEFGTTAITNAFEHTGDSLRQVDTLAASLTTPITNTFFNEARVQYAKDSEPGTANSTNPEATIRQGGQTVMTIGRAFLSPRETTIKRNQIADTATLLTGRHTIKAGVDLNRDKIYNLFQGNFSGSYTFQTIASFQRGRPSGANETYVQAFPGPGTTGPVTRPNLTETALFVHDEWQIRPNLTLNAGLRYDLQDMEQPSVRNPDAQLVAAGLDTSRIPVDRNNIAPRLGLAWTPAFSQRTVVRAGYGIFYGRTPAIMISTAHSNNGINVQTITFTGSSVPTYPDKFASLPTGAAAPKPTIFVFSKDYQNPQVHQGSFGIEHALTSTISLTASLLWVQGNDLSRTIDINVGPAAIENINISTGGSVPVKRYSADPSTRPFQNFNRVMQFQSTADSDYKGVTLDLSKRFGQNWQARIAYTYARVRDNRPDATAVVPESTDDAKIAWDPTDFRLEWGRGDNDVPHRLVLSGVWNLDYGKREAWWSKMLVDGWALSAIVNWQSGFPYAAMVNADLNRDGNRRSDRAPGFARNSFRTENQLSIDPRITKSFGLMHDVRLQLIVEAFNITNESNINPSGGNGIVGQGLQNNYYSFANNVLTPISTFGTPVDVGGAAGSGPRTIQLAARVTF